MKWLHIEYSYLKDSEFFGIFYYFSYFGTILFIIIIIKRFRILRNLLLFFEFRFYPFYYSVFSESPFARANLRNRNAFSHQTSHTCRPSPLIVHLIFFEPIQIQILDLEPNPCFQTFLIISKTYHQIFNCNTSKLRSGQELPFIFFEPRASTYLWGRYDPKPKILQFFTYISSTSTLFQKHFTSLCRATLMLYFMLWLLRCTLWLERIMSPDLKFPSLLKHYRKSP